MAKVTLVIEDIKDGANIKITTDFEDAQAEIPTGATVMAYMLLKHAGDLSDQGLKKVN
jgi:hypothetical protein